MSRFKFKANFENLVRTIELERQKYDLNILKDKASKAFNQSQVTIRYTASTGESYFLSNDAQLQKALKDAEKAKFIEVKVYKDTSSGNASVGVSAQPAQQQQQQQQQRSAPAPAPSSSTPAPATSSSSASAPRAAAAAPAQQNPSGVLLTFRIQPLAGGPDRVAVDAQQNADHFLFELKASKHETDVEVKLDGTSLLYLTSHTVQEGATTKTIKGTQGISLPFNPSPDTISISGNKIKIMFPR